MNKASNRTNYGFIVVLGAVLGLCSMNPVLGFDFQALPGAVEMPVNVQAEIKNAWDGRTSRHDVRSQHRQEDGTPLFANRLLLESSPYLRQHAHNPVNWYSWSGDKFSVATNLQRPILLSIGYSSCHWCHVMEEQSYDNVEIARVLNENFVTVKVDRETNPDVDELYLLAMQVMGRPGGWPLNVFLTPEGKPFLGMTYLPPDEFLRVLKAVESAWSSNRSRVEMLAEEITQVIRKFGMTQSMQVNLEGEQVDWIVDAMTQREQSKDEFSQSAASFPSESELLMLLDTAVRYQNEAALLLVENRLTDMALGGIRDHVGGGFHRYTVDSEWRIPHFEKMLYNQAHITRAYLYYYRIAGGELYRRVAEQALDYVLRDMMNENGVFYSATDADSEGEEGEFFLWTLEEIRQVAGENSEIVIDTFDIFEQGNFEGKNILYMSTTPELRAAESELSTSRYLEILAQTKEKLRIYRDRRVKPFLDTKIITAWNAMMVTTLAEAGRNLENDRYLQAAITAGEYLWNSARDEHGQLYRIQIDGQLTEPAKLRDFAYLSLAFLTLFDETGNRVWLERSEQLAEQMLEAFWDQERGGFYSVSNNEAQGLIARQKDRFDRAVPSGNSIAAHALSRLFYRTGKRSYGLRVEQLFQAFGVEILQSPTSFTYALLALEEHRGGSSDEMEYAASGHAKVSVSVTEADIDRIHAVVELELDDGWHVQSDQPAGDNLFATQIDISTDDWVLVNAVYPPAEILSTSFQSDPLSVFSGKIRIPIELVPKGPTAVATVVDVRLQACDDKLCLLPETVRLEIPRKLITG